MAGALVGGAFLSGFVNVVLDRLITHEAVNLVVGKKLGSELVERLKTAMAAANALLVDAERKQFDNPEVKNWLDSLMDAVYRADDLLDHVFTKAATKKEVSTFWPRLLFIDSQDREVVNRIEGVVRRIEDLEKRKYILGLEKISFSRTNLSWGSPSTSLVKGNVFGRENDQEAISKMITGFNEHQLSVIPIVGMGGVGKTTIAQWVYNSEDLMKGFDLKVWICVSERFDVLEITKAIIEGITKSTCNLKDLNLLQLELKEKLSNKKFFVVLDDVWSHDHHDWANFKTPFSFGSLGSKILVTTRSEKVASVVKTSPVYFLNELSEDYCWLVFADNACIPESNNGTSNLEEIGRKIVRKCKGLPLAAETLGRMLRQEHDVKKWNAILMSDIWEFPVEDSKIIPALLISYYHLPTYLKRCFVYCSLFPKDHQFNKDELILLWMAEDLLRPPKRGETLEEVGCESFDDLVSRLFFKKFEANHSHSFVMHDLLHDLAVFLAKDFYCRLEELGNAQEMSIHTRHLSYGSLSAPISRNLDSIDKVESLRTFLPIKFFHHSLKIESVTCDAILSKLKHLRVLSFNSFYELDVLPDSIGELIHLRYLDLSQTSIKILPESLCNLYNLQTLRLCWCSHLDMLPNAMHTLVNLRHFDISGTNIKEMPMGMSKLKHLQFLSSFSVGQHEDNGIKELGDLSNLHYSLDIKKLENVANSDEAMGAKIMDKIHIDKLCLQWSSSSDGMISDTEAERDILDKLQPQIGLKRLTIEGYRGTRFPYWVGHSSYHNMTLLRLVSCGNCCMMPSLGQLPCLMYLWIQDFRDLEIIDDGFYKSGEDHSSCAAPFPSLVELKFYNMPCWEVWRSSYSNAFPQLKTLQIRDCPRLKGDIPSHLAALETLNIHRCQELVSTLRAPKISILEISESDKIRLQELPPSAETLSIDGCQPVESMFQAMTSNNDQTCLKVLKMSNCSSAISFPGDCLPSSLKTLEIKDCRRLEFPKQQQQQKHELQELQLYNSCDSLTSLPLDIFPNLKNLKIEGCENLESLSLSESQHSAFASLEIKNCPNFVSFPIEGLAAPNMTSFSVFSCNKLKSLPCHMNTLLPILEHLTVKDCPEADCFPEGGLPPSLKSLVVNYSEKLLTDPVLKSLTFLVLHGASCESVKSFPNQSLLPQLPSLTTLHLNGFSSLETLDCDELRRLTTLHRLEIEDCPKLENMEGERLPSSLSGLYIYDNSLLAELCKMKHPQIEDCPKLENMEGERLPSSLSGLYIYDNSLLAELCKMKHPQIWPKISHIPNIQFEHSGGFSMSSTVLNRLSSLIRQAVEAYMYESFSPFQ